MAPLRPDETALADAGQLLTDLHIHHPTSPDPSSGYHHARVIGHYPSDHGCPRTQGMVTHGLQHSVGLFARQDGDQLALVGYV
jgi:hypothetical protein